MYILYEETLFPDLFIVEKGKLKPKKYFSSSAVFSDNRKYRYLLTRIWDTNKKPDLWIMLNPSEADEKYDDPTIRRCMGFSQDNQAGGIIVINLFAWIDSHSSWLYPQKQTGTDIIGKDNENYFDQYCTDDYRIICAWGNIPAGLEFPQYKTLMIQEKKNRLLCLHTNCTGWPTHPLYMPRETDLKNYALP